jgi:hypothetical protein
MELQIFGSFTKMINGLPTRAVLMALDLECKMLKNDIEVHRLDFSEDAFSIMSFRQFVRLAKQDEAMQCLKPLPPDHLEFYKKTIVRLIQANELPSSAMKLFDKTFRSISEPKM